MIRVMVPKLNGSDTLLYFLSLIDDGGTPKFDRCVKVKDSTNDGILCCSASSSVNVSKFVGVALEVRN